MNANSSSSDESCPKCGKPLGPDAPAGLCPSCLLAVNLEPPADESVPKGPHGTVILTENQPPPSPEDLAQHFPQLEILRCLGQGGMGAVYLARQKSLNRLVALKILLPSRAAALDFAERFSREAQALARLNHPNIVTVHDFGQAGGQFYLLMEYVEGANLRELLNSTRFSPQEALALIPPICEALQYAHDQGIVHRDIKPENLLLDHQGRVKIADFGIARILGQTEESAPAAPAPWEPHDGLTKGRILGTPRYMAPEQAISPDMVDHRADIYSLGVVLYEMLTGEIPEIQLNPSATRLSKVSVEVKLDEIVLRALEREPARRYQSASQMKTSVEEVTHPSSQAQGDQPAAEAPVQGPAWARTITLAGLVVAVGLLLASMFRLGVLEGILVASLGLGIHRMITKRPIPDRFLAYVAFLLCIPILSLTLYFLIGLLSERGGWHPHPAEAVTVTVVVLFLSWLFPWATYALFQAHKTRRTSAASGWKEGMILGSILIGLLIVGFFLVQRSRLLQMEAQALREATMTAMGKPRPWLLSRSMVQVDHQAQNFHSVLILPDAPGWDCWLRVTEWTLADETRPQPRIHGTTIRKLSLSTKARHRIEFTSNGVKRGELDRAAEFEVDLGFLQMSQEEWSALEQRFDPIHQHRWEIQESDPHVILLDQSSKAGERILCELLMRPTPKTADMVRPATFVVYVDEVDVDLQEGKARASYQVLTMPEGYELAVETHHAFVSEHELDGSVLESRYLEGGTNHANRSVVILHRDMGEIHWTFPTLSQSASLGPVQSSAPTRGNVPISLDQPLGLLRLFNPTNGHLHASAELRVLPKSEISILNPALDTQTVDTLLQEALSGTPGSPYPMAPPGAVSTERHILRLPGEARMQVSVHAKEMRNNKDHILVGFPPFLTHPDAAFGFEMVWRLYRFPQGSFWLVDLVDPVQKQVFLRHGARIPEDWDSQKLQKAFQPSSVMDYGDGSSFQQSLIRMEKGTAAITDYREISIKVRWVSHRRDVPFEPQFQLPRLNPPASTFSPTPSQPVPTGPKHDDSGHQNPFPSDPTTRSETNSFSVPRNTEKATTEISILGSPYHLNFTLKPRNAMTLTAYAEHEGVYMRLGNAMSVIGNPGDEDLTFASEFELDAGQPQELPKLMGSLRQVGTTALRASLFDPQSIEWPLGASWKAFGSATAPHSGKGLQHEAGQHVQLPLFTAFLADGKNSPGRIVLRLEVESLKDAEWKELSPSPSKPAVWKSQNLETLLSRPRWAMDPGQATAMVGIREKDVLMMGQGTSAEAAVKSLQELLQDKPCTIHFLVDRSLPFRRILEVLPVFEQAGYTQIRITDESGNPIGKALPKPAEVPATPPDDLKQRF